GVLESLAERAAGDGQFQTELARHYAERGNAPLAEAAHAKARALFKEKLAKEPENSAWAAELAEVLLIDSRARWTVLKPVEAKSELGATLSILPDDSILASGANPRNDRYRVVLTVGTDIDLTAVRLEALTHPSLPGNGPGRASGGWFAQTSWNVTAASRDRKDPIRLDFNNAWADHQSSVWLINSNGHWNTGGGGEGQNCTAIWSMSNPVSLAAGTKLTFEMQFKAWNDIRENLGRFRLSATSDPATVERKQKRSTAMKIADPWAQLAAVYQIPAHPKP